MGGYATTIQCKEKSFLLQRRKKPSQNCKIFERFSRKIDDGNLAQKPQRILSVLRQMTTGVESLQVLRSYPSVCRKRRKRCSIHPYACEMDFLEMELKRHPWKITRGSQFILISLEATKADLDDILPFLEAYGSHLKKEVEEALKGGSDLTEICLQLNFCDPQLDLSPS